MYFKDISSISLPAKPGQTETALSAIKDNGIELEAVSEQALYGTGKLTTLLTLLRSVGLDQPIAFADLAKTLAAHEVGLAIEESSGISDKMDVAVATFVNVLLIGPTFWLSCSFLTTSLLYFKLDCGIAEPDNVTFSKEIQIT